VFLNVLSIMSANYIGLIKQEYCGNFAVQLVLCKVVKIRVSVAPQSEKRLEIFKNPGPYH
jgi:hypothetical protein